MRALARFPFGLVSFPTVMPGNSRSKNDIALLAYGAAPKVISLFDKSRGFGPQAGTGHDDV